MQKLFVGAVLLATVQANKHPEVTWIFRQLAGWSALAGDQKTAWWAAEKLLRAQVFAERIGAGMSFGVGGE
jgi:hypothetical protein